MIVQCLDNETYRTPDGQVFTTHSRPTEAAPDGRFDSDKYGWHSVLCRWVPLDKIDEPCVAEMDDGE